MLSAVVVDLSAPVVELLGVSSAPSDDCTDWRDLHATLDLHPLHLLLQLPPIRPWPTNDVKRGDL